jgi:hypothetical protein
MISNFTLNFSIFSPWLFNVSFKHNLNWKIFKKKRKSNEAMEDIYFCKKIKNSNCLWHLNELILKDFDCLRNENERRIMNKNIFGNKIIDIWSENEIFFVWVKWKSHKFYSFFFVCGCGKTTISKIFLAKNLYPIQQPASMNHHEFDCSKKNVEFVVRKILYSKANDSV